MAARLDREPRQLIQLIAAAIVVATLSGIGAAAASTTSLSRLHAQGPARANLPTCSARTAASGRLAARLAGAITAALRSRFTGSDAAYDPFEDVSVQLQDNSRGLSCWFRVNRQYFSASAIKATILAALLLRAQSLHRGLDRWEKAMAWAMITRSDNSAASALWKHVGLRWLQRFLNLAGMRHTVLNTWGAWGLTEITAHDETQLLLLLTTRGTVLTDKSRWYELYLMNHVVSYQAWGVRAGSPKSFTWHIKNGWAPLPNLAVSPWVVNSIGCFIGKTDRYTIVVLTHLNPGSGPAYGIATIEAIAWAINRDLHPSATSIWPRSAFQRRWLTPDEVLPRPPAGPVTAG